MKKIAHIASHGINVGDGAIHAVTKMILKNTIGEFEYIPIDVVQLDWSGEPITAEYLDGLGVDHIIVGGGGAIDGHVGKPSGMALHVTGNEILRVQTPMTFLALGHNLFRSHNFDGSAGLRNLILACAEREIPFSVREDGSIVRLASIVGFDAAKHVQVVPDPGMFIPHDPSFEIPVDGDYAIIQLASDNIELRIGDAAASDRFLKDTGEILTHIISARGLNIVFALHTIQDMNIPTFVMGQMQWQDLRPNAYTTGTMHPSFCNRFYSYYYHSKLVLGMRGHSVMCGVGLDRPTIAIDTHDKVEGFMSSVGLLENAVKPSSRDYVSDTIKLVDRALSGDIAKMSNSKRGKWIDSLYNFFESSLSGRI